MKYSLGCQAKSLKMSFAFSLLNWIIEDMGDKCLFSDLQRSWEFKELRFCVSIQSIGVLFLRGRFVSPCASSSPDHRWGWYRYSKSLPYVHFSVFHAHLVSPLHFSILYTRKTMYILGSISVPKKNIACHTPISLTNTESTEYDFRTVSF